MSAIDSMTMSAPRTRVELVVPKPTKEAREKGADMKIIGCDYHPGFQQIANWTSELKQMWCQLPGYETAALRGSSNVNVCTARSRLRGNLPDASHRADN